MLVEQLIEELGEYSPHMEVVVVVIRNGNTTVHEPDLREGQPDGGAPYLVIDWSPNR